MYSVLFGRWRPRPDLCRAALQPRGQHM